MCGYTILATVPGIPTVFYGDEAGLEGYKDPFNRMPYPWGKEDGRLIRFYQSIGKLRKENPVYEGGDFKLLHLDDSLLVFSRTDGEFDYITVINNSDSEIRLSFDKSASELIYSSEGMEHTLEDYSGGIYKTEKGATLEIN